MINIHRISIFVEGEKFEFNGADLPACNPDNAFPIGILKSYAARLVSELLSPNKRTDHACVETCKKLFAIKIGATDTRTISPDLKNSVPK